MNGYEWDENKRILNIRKHGFDFVDLVPMLEAGNVHVHEDSDHSYAEPRYHAYGLCRGIPVQVTFTFRDESIRIISARRPTPAEWRTYGTLH